MDLPTSPLVIDVLICELSLSRLFAQSIEGNISDQLSALIDIRLGNEARLDLILPERPMDLQFLASNLRTLGIDAMPAPLHQFFKDLVQFLLTDDAAVSTVPQPMPPTTISLHDISYDIECTLDVRRRAQQLGNINIAPPPSGGDWPELANVPKRQDAVEASALVPVTCEYTLDLESKDGRSACLVDCQDPRNDVLWNEFLHRPFIYSRQSLNGLIGHPHYTEPSTVRGLAGATMHSRWGKASQILFLCLHLHFC
ncbi:hypothetical protein BS47DRAFT_967586 [Hydnum rufescens UP504]|uniref:Uncharacterized protein n=1 Tax=Hydnum rufescens UP504 TaxID=1448309 RepID=A0A9P6DSN5_9AGAM|nr:hypothetical protein BS47DRAFT_967586 [Hydnum rufescens UP504]